MNKYLKEFLHRGLMFGGFGPIITGIVYLILSYTLKDLSLSGVEVFIAIVSTYVLAFVHAGASIFNQIEEWPIMKSLLVNLVTLYVAYTSCYLINSWIPFDWTIILIFTAIFVAGFAIIWVIIYFCSKRKIDSLNKLCKEKI